VQQLEVDDVDDLFEVLQPAANAILARVNVDAILDAVLDP